MKQRRQSGLVRAGLLALLCLWVPAPAGIAWAQEAQTRPAENPQAPPPRAALRVTSTVAITREQVKVRLVSVQHQASYRVDRGTLVPVPRGATTPMLRADIVAPESAAPAMYSALINQVEDDAGTDLLKPFRLPNGAVAYSSSGTFAARANNEPAQVTFPLRDFPRPPRRLGRLGGEIVLSFPTEVAELDLPIDNIGAAGDITPALSVVVNNVAKLNDGILSITLRTNSTDGSALAMQLGVPFLLRAEGVDERGKTIAAMAVSRADPQTINLLFSPAIDARPRKIRLILVTKALRVPVVVDIRSTPVS